MKKQQLITELQSYGLRLESAAVGAKGRRGGAGPSDHKAVTVDGTTVMVPIYTGTASQSPYTAELIEGSHQATLTRATTSVADIEFPVQPKFYGLTTADGIPYWKIALLHSHDVLATTVQQTCLRYRDESTACQFCAIEKSLDQGRTIARKTPEQLAEVAAAAVRLDGVSNMIMTTGTPNHSDRGAAYLAECARAIKARVNLPIQAQCEPPDDFVWFERMKQAGIDSLGMHLEAVAPAIRAKIMPGKAAVPVSVYFEAFAAAVNSQAFQDIAKAKYFTVDIRSGEAADKRAAQLEAISAATFTKYADQIGAPVKSPADLGLPEPEVFEAWWPPEGYTPVSG